MHESSADRLAEAAKPMTWPAALSPALVYGAVFVGMHVLESGWAAIVGYHVVVCLVLTFSKGWPKSAILTRGWQTGLGLAMVAGCLVSGALLWVLWDLVRLEDVSLPGELREVGLTGWAWVAFIAYYSLVNPWLEELYWRGWYPAKVPSGLVSDLLFAGYHVIVLVLFVSLPWVLLCFAILICVALVWRVVAARLGGLLVPSLSHLAADVSIIAAATVLAARG